MNYWKKVFAAIALSAFLAGASSPKGKDDKAKEESASEVVNKVAGILGASDLKSLAYSGTGFAYAFGQSYLPGGPYPKFYARYSRVIDFDKSLSVKRRFAPSSRSLPVAEADSLFTAKPEA